MTIHGDRHSKPFTISYTLSNVIIEETCTGDHDFDEWKYDYMGGDLRSCKRCDLTQYA